MVKLFGVLAVGALVCLLAAGGGALYLMHRYAAGCRIIGSSPTISRRP